MDMDSAEKAGTVNNKPSSEGFFLETEVVEFRREKRKLDLLHGKIVEHSRRNGIEHPAYPSAQVRALCTKFYGQEAHPKFGHFTHGRFERDPFTK